MAYALMLLADPGPERARVLCVLREAPDIRPDPHLDNRFWLTTEHGQAQLNIGTKDPVESVHLEVETGSLPLLESAARRALELAQRLDMRVEDVHWGHEVTAANLPGLFEYWRGWRPHRPASAEPPAPPRPWWRFW